GRIYIPSAGSYGFATEQLSESHFFVDGTELLANIRENNLIERRITLSPGWHDISLHYLDAAGYSHLYLYWSPPGHDRSIIPSAFLWPQLGSYPDKAQTGAWPTLQEADGAVIPARAG